MFFIFCFYFCLYLINVGVIEFPSNLKYLRHSGPPWEPQLLSNWKREYLARVARDVFFGGGGS